MTIDPQIASIAELIGALGSFGALIIGAMNRGTSKKNNAVARDTAVVLKEVRTDVANVRIELTTVRTELTTVRTELVEHKAMMGARVSFLEAEVGRLRDERHDRNNELQKAIFAAAKVAAGKPGDE